MRRPLVREEFTLNNAIRWLIVLVVTYVVSVAGSAPVFVTSIFVPEAITYPLTLLVMGLLAGLTSSWISNLLCGDSTHSRLLRVLEVTEAAAVLLLIVPVPIIFLWGAIVSVSGYLAARKFRSPIYSKKSNIIWSVILLALAAILVMAAITAASHFGLTGA
jgi:H+/Cl- antiporter ClcA